MHRKVQVLQEFIDECQLYRTLAPYAFFSDAHFVQWCSAKVHGIAQQDWKMAVRKEGNKALTWEYFKHILEKNLHLGSTESNYYVQRFHSVPHEQG
jgi:hypothetical protein